MNVEKLHALAVDLLDDYDKTGMPASLKSLQKTLQNQVSNPAEPTFQQALSDNLGKIREALHKAPSNNFPNEWKDMMEQLKIDEFFGEKMLKTIENIFYQNQITPSLALGKINALLESAMGTHTHAQQIIGSFKFFNIEKDDLEQGQCEVSITIPKNHKNKLDEFGEEISNLGIDFRPLAALVNQTPDEFKVRSLSSSDLTVFIETGTELCLAISSLTYVATTIYNALLKTKEIQAKIKDSDAFGATVEREVAKAVKAQLASLTEKHAKKFIKEIRDELGLSPSKAKGKEPKELETEIERSLQNTIKRLDNGIRFNVRGELHIITNEEGDGDSQQIADKKLDNSYIQKINNDRKLLLEFNPDVEALQELLPDLSESESDTSQNQNDEDSK